MSLSIVKDVVGLFVAPEVSKNDNKKDTESDEDPKTVSKKTSKKKQNKRPRLVSEEKEAEENGDDKDDKMEDDGDDDDEATVKNDIKELKTDVRRLMDQMDKQMGRMDQVLEVLTRVDNLSLKVDKNEARVKKVEEAVKEGCDEMKVLRETNAHLVSRVEKLEYRLDSQEKKSVDQESRGRRNNVIIRGLPEKTGPEVETMEEAKKLTLEFIKKECKITDTVIIERAHRIPTHKVPDSNKPRPMIAKFLDFNDKTAVKNARRNLPPNSDFRISDDLPKEIRQARQRLNSDVMKHRDAGREAWVVFPAKLIVDGRFVREEPIIKDTSVNPRSRERDSNDRRDYARSDPSPRRDFRGPRYNNRSDSRPNYQGRGGYRGRRGQHQK